METPLNGTNPLNVDPPDSVESFAEGFNASAIEYIDEVETYEEILAEVEEVNTIGGQVVNLVRMRGGHVIEDYLMYVVGFLSDRMSNTYYRFCSSSLSFLPSPLWSNRKYFSRISKCGGKKDKEDVTVYGF